MVWYKSNVIDVGTLAQNILSTASGSIVHITDGADNIPVKSLVSQIVAVESGSGEKSPDNPYTISGFDSGIITVTDNDQITNTYTFTFGQTIFGGHFDNKGNLVVTHYFVDLGSLTYGKGTGGNERFTAQLPLTPIVPQSQTEIGDIISDIYTTTTSRDIYSGSGNYLVAIHTNGLLWIKNTDYSDVNTFKTAMSGHCVVYALANPITLSITSQDIPTALGENNIFSNCGDVEVNYYNANANVIADLIRSL